MRTMHAHTCTHTQETKCWYNPEVVREGRQYRQKHLFRVLKRERVQTGQRNTMAGCYEIGWDVYVWEETHSFWWGGGGGMKPRLLFYLPFQKSLQKLNCIFKISLEILFPFSQPLTVALDIRIYKLLLRMIQPQSQVFFFFFLSCDFAGESNDLRSWATFSATFISLFVRQYICWCIPYE